jgi:hypothetical protein
MSARRDPAGRQTTHHSGFLSRFGCPAFLWRGSSIQSSLHSHAGPCVHPHCTPSLVPAVAARATSLRHLGWSEAIPAHLLTPSMSAPGFASARPSGPPVFLAPQPPSPWLPESQSSLGPSRWSGHGLGGHWEALRARQAPHTSGRARCGPRLVRSSPPRRQ